MNIAEETGKEPIAGKKKSIQGQVAQPNPSKKTKAKPRARKKAEFKKNDDSESITSLLAT